LLFLLLLVAVLAEGFKQPDAGSQSKTGFTRNACAAWPDSLQGAVPFFADDLDFPDTEQLDLFTARDFLGQRFEVTLDRFTDEFLGERSLLASKSRAARPEGRYFL
jgi:hypothetical protein